MFRGIQERDSRGEGQPATFTFLGFTHFCGKRQNGALTVWRETAKKPMVEGLKLEGDTAPTERLRYNRLLARNHHGNRDVLRLHMERGIHGLPT
jgi:hypothetical protein